MSQETIIISQSSLFLNVTGRRITALPETGTIATVERLAATSTFLSGLHDTAVHNLNTSKARRLTINVIPMSADDEFLNLAIAAIGRFGKLIPVSLSYQNVKYAAGACSIEGDPVRNFTGEGAEVMAYPMVGVFEIGVIRKFVNPGVLTAAEISAL